MTNDELRREKARKLIELSRIREIYPGVFIVKGNGGEYRTEYRNRATACTCQAGSIWGVRSLRRYGKHVCYHLEAAAMMKRGA